MMSKSLLRLALSSLAVTTALSAGAAEACSRIAQSAIRGFQVLPAEGSLVPRSTSLWLRSDTAIGDSTDGLREASAVRLVDERGKSVPLVQSSVRVAGERPATLFVFKPSALLEGERSYRVELNGAVLSRFTTSQEIDTVPPLSPTAKLVEVKAEQPVGSFSCGAPSSLTVAVEQPGDVTFLVQAAPEASLTMPGAALAVASGPDLTANAVPEGALELRVVTFDLSGNMAMSREKLSTFVPADGAAGCSTAVGAPLLGLFALLFRRRRR